MNMTIVFMNTEYYECLGSDQHIYYYPRHLGTSITVTGIPLVANTPTIAVGYHNLWLNLQRIILLFMR
jgi:hypothetical protein